MKNPKSEIRNPKEGRRREENAIPKDESRRTKEEENPNTEIRIPKVESRNTRYEGRSLKGIGNPSVEAMLGEFEFWGLAEEAAGTQALREDGMGPPPPRRDLRERTALFAEAVIRFAKKVPRGPITNRLIDQVVSASSSVAANFCEADDAVSGKDFKKSIGTCRKEAKEAMLFLRLIATAEESLAPEARKLWREAKELNLIFGAIWRK